MNAYSVIFVVGGNRCGTTLLDVLLGNDKASFSLGEVYGLFRPVERFHMNLGAPHDDETRKFWKSMGHLKEKKLYDRIHEKTGARFIIDSSKYLPWVIDQAKRCGKHDVPYKVIAIAKDLEQYAFSLFKRHEEPQHAYMSYVQYYLNLSSTKLPLKCVHYNDLVRRYEGTMEKLVSYTGQPDDVDRRDFSKRRPYHVFGSGGTRDQVTQGCRIDLKEDPRTAPGFAEYWEELMAIDRKHGKAEVVSAFLADHDIFNDHTREQPKMVERPLWYYYMKIRRYAKTKYLRCTNKLAENHA